jgi:hypothetical protein
MAIVSMPSDSIDITFVYSDWLSAAIECAVTLNINGAVGQRSASLGHNSRYRNLPMKRMVVCGNKCTGCFIMYSGFNKIYDRKIVGHVFTKPVQIEDTAQFFSLQKVEFHRSLHFCRQAMRVYK